MQRYCRLHLSDKSYLRVSEELHYIAYLLAIGYLLFYLTADIENVILTIEHQAIGIGYVADDFLVLAQTLHSLLVGSCIFYGVVDGNDIWWNILGNEGIGTYHSVSAYAGIGIDNNVGRENDVIFYEHLACYLAAIAYYVVVTYVDIVADVHALHEEVVGADACSKLLAFIAGACYGDILAKDIVIAYDGECLTSMIVEILGYGTDNGSLVHLIVLAHAGAVHDAGEGIDNTVVAYLHVTFYVGEWHDGYVIAYLRLGVYVCFVGNHRKLKVIDPLSVLWTSLPERESED